MQFLLVVGCAAGAGIAAYQQDVKPVLITAFALAGVELGYALSRLRHRETWKAERSVLHAPDLLNAGR